MICQQDLTNWLSTQNPIQNILCLMVSIAFIHHNAGFYQSPNLSLVLLVTWCSEVIVSDYSLRGDHAETSCSPFKNGHRSFATPKKGHFATPKFGHAILNGPPCIKNKGTPPWGGCGFSTIVYLVIESKITFLHCNLQCFMLVIYDVLTFAARCQNAKKNFCNSATSAWDMNT